LNPIEYIWNKVDRRLRKLTNPSSNKNDLWENLKIVWDGIEVDYCNKLIDSMPERINDVIKGTR
jgi:hypothetical protein